MYSKQEYYITCDGVDLHCKLDLPACLTEGCSDASDGFRVAAGSDSGAADGCRVAAGSDSGAADGCAHQRVPLVIVIPGLTGDMEEPQIVSTAEALAGNGYACLRVELYGHGKSGGAFYDHTLFHWAVELMQVIDHARRLDFVSELFLCGHSQGGAAAVLGAGLKPDFLSGLILLAPAMVIKDSARAGGFPAPSFDPDHIPDETKVFTDSLISGNYYRVNRMLPFDDAVALYGGRPVLVVHSPTDEYVPYQYSVRTAGAYPNAELFTVPDDDHCFAAHMDLVAAKVIEFLDKIRK